MTYMLNLTEFSSIRPYTDEEAVVALGKVADHPLLPQFSQKFFPDQAPDFLKNILKNVTSVDDFQVKVMSRFVAWVLQTTATGFTCNGIENINSGKKFLVLSNHRDIILDPAIVQLVLFQNNIPLTEIAVGDNLISGETMEYLLRSNRMIKVVRGISARELYLSSQMLSKYIRVNLTNQRSSIWLAQRQGRTKDGNDQTEQGLLKMLDMSGSDDFQKSWEELNVVPMSISYEYEPCDILKAREIVISSKQKYVKAEGEDLNSILTGVQQPKGNVHLEICTPLSSEEIAKAAACDKNERYQQIKLAVDRRVIGGYKLWKTHYIAYDIVYQTGKYASMYEEADVQKFVAYMEHQLNTVEPELDRGELKKVFLDIYANPVVSKEQLENM